MLWRTEKIKNYYKPQKIVECISQENYVRFMQAIKTSNTEYREKGIIVFGCGIMGHQFSYMLEKCGITNYVFADNACEKWGKIIEGHEVIPVSSLKERLGNFFVYIAVEEYEQCKNQLEEYGYLENKDFCNLKNYSQDLLKKEFIRNESDYFLLMGDCTLSTISMIDQEIISIKCMIEKKFAYNQFVSLDLNGLYMRSYYNLLLMKLKFTKNPKKILFFMNVDIFSDKYHLFPQNQHYRLIKNLMEITQCDEIEITDFVRDIESRANQNSIFNYLSPDRESDIPLEKIVQNKRIHTKLNYLFKLNKNSESIKYLKLFIDKCEKEKIETYIIILPVNYQEGIELFKEEFIYKYDLNCAGIRQYIKGNKIHVIDQSYLLSKEDFISIRSISEGIRDSGRKKIVEHLFTIISNNKEVN